MNMFMFLMFLISILFMNFNNPFIMGILILIQTMNMIMIMGKIYYSFWFSFILFLVFVGGLFILFFYLISLMYNNKFFYYINKFYLMFIFMFLFLNYKNIFFNNSEKLLNFNLIHETLNLIKLYNYPNNVINILLIIMLLMLMIIVVKITNFSIGPIRSK